MSAERERVVPVVSPNNIERLLAVLLIVLWLSLLATTMKRMAGSELWTAEELERLSPDEYNEIIRAGIVTDLEDVPLAFLDRVRANVHDHISTSESAATTER